MGQFNLFHIIFIFLFFSTSSIRGLPNKPKKLLIVGNGGREHALAWKIAQSPLVSEVFVAPGNGGTAQEPKAKNISIASDDIEALADFAVQNNIDLTIVGPEAPLAKGIVDLFEQRKLRCLGPSKAAAHIESSKIFAKEFMHRHGIPTSDYATFTNVIDAQEYIQNQRLPIVIKADGLAGGKGVIIAQTKEEAFDALDHIMVKRTFGDAGKKIIIEEFLQGQEVNLFVLTDGKAILPLSSAYDYKRKGENDSGKNTGGMGAYSPVEIMTPCMQEKIIKEIVEPTLKGLEDAGTPFVGFLYVDCMIDTLGQQRVIEYNCRLGDPETQVIMMRLQSDLVPLCFAATNGNLDEMQIQWNPRTAVGVVLVADSYPDSYRKGDYLNLPSEYNDSVKIFHAGTTIKDARLLTSGGRVLCVTSLGSTLKQARKNVYQTVKNSTWPGCYYRNDIGLQI